MVSFGRVDYCAVQGGEGEEAPEEVGELEADVYEGGLVDVEG